MVDKWVNIAGFGRTQMTPAGQESQGDPSNVMLESTVKVISDIACDDMYGNIDYTQVCAAAPGTDTCQVKIHSKIILFIDFLNESVNRVIVEDL